MPQQKNLKTLYPINLNLIQWLVKINRTRWYLINILFIFNFLRNEYLWVLDWRDGLNFDGWSIKILSSLKINRVNVVDGKVIEVLWEKVFKYLLRNSGSSKIFSRMPFCIDLITGGFLIGDPSIQVIINSWATCRDEILSESNFLT